MYQGMCMPLCCLLLLLAVAFAQNQTAYTPALPIGALNQKDKEHFLEVFKNFKADNPKEAHYAFIGNSAFEKELVGVSCETLKPHFDSSDVETQYYALSAARGVKGCKPVISKPNQLKTALKDEKLSVDKTFYIVASALMANVPIEKAEILKLLSNFATKETSPSSLSTILAIAANLKGTTDKDLEQFSPLVGKLVDQADEYDGAILFFERGAYTTAFAVESIFNFAAALKKVPALTEQQVIKFANFLFERRRAHQIRTAARVASAFKVLARNSFMNPLVVYGASASERAGVSGILVPPSRRIVIRLFDIFGVPLNSGVSVKASKIYPDIEDSKPVGSSNLGEFKLNNGAFELDLGTKDGVLPRGRYNLELTAVLSQKKPGAGNLAGATNIKVPLRVISPLKVEKGQLKVTESSKTLVDTAVAYPGNRYSEVIRMHHTARLRLAFALEDAVAASSSSKAPGPHQVFVQLTHSRTQQAITYVAKRSTTDGTYAFTLGLDSAASEFDYTSGTYKMEVVIGDALIEKPIIWHVADVDLHFPVNEDAISSSSSAEDIARQTVASATARKRSVHPLIGDAPTSSKPLLEHTFRTPEPRPSNLLAFTFTGLCCAPLAILILAWPLMGANLSNLPCSLSTPLFHLGLGGIFALYLVYWYKLNMFATLRYLIILGLFTFVTGNRLLRQLVAKRRKVKD